MTFARTCRRWTLATGLIALVSSAASAEWKPQWSTAWQHPELQHTAQPMRVGIAKDGATFALGGVTHHSQAHVALMKFDATGGFSWLRERVASSVVGMAFLNGRVVIAGEGGTLAAPVYLSSYDAATGDLIWDHLVAEGNTHGNTLGIPQQLSVDSNGNLMLVLSDHGDYVVARSDPDGNALPTWRRTIDQNNDVLATGIVALPDGGAILTGRGRQLGGGYVTARLDAQGSEVFTDVELGDLGNPLGPAYVALSPDGSVVIAATPESFDGVFLGQVWKLSSSGERLWTRVVPHPGGSFPSSMIDDLLLTADGDAVIETTGGSAPFRAWRLASSTGDVIWDVAAPISGSPTTLAITTSGRLLIGSGDSGQESGHIAELDAGGNPCRVANSLGMFSNVIAAAGTDGWSVLGASQVIPGTGRNAFISHFDEGGACTLTDVLFNDGFD